MSVRSLPPRTQPGHRSPIGSAWLSVLCRRALHDTFEMRHRQALLVVRSRLLRVAGGRSNRTGLPWSGCHPLARRSGVVEHRSPTKAAATRRRVLVRLADALGGRVSCASWSSGLPVPLLSPRGRNEGQNPRAVNQIGTRSPAPWSNARKTTSPAPQSKPVTPRLAPRGARRAVGGIRAWAEDPGRRASLPTTLLLLRAPV
jgi:hypothetical protein